MRFPKENGTSYSPSQCTFFEECRARTFISIAPEAPSVMLMDIDRKTGAGMLIGFFLAATILFGYVQLAMAPNYQGLLQTKKYVQLGYDITHSIGYADAQAFVGKINTGAEELATLPLIGMMANKSNVAQYTQTMVDMMQGRKEIAEQEMNLINTKISLIQFSLPALIVSILLVGAGIYMLMEEKKPAAKARKGRKR